MDHAAMRRAIVNALDIDSLIVDMNEYIRKPSHYTVAETSVIVSNALTAIEILSRNNEVQG